MDDATLTDLAMVINRHPGIKDRPIPYGSPITDDTAGIDDDALTQSHPYLLHLT
jgi:hypothetical protein